jgi:hypothetical protein
VSLQPLGGPLKTSVAAALNGDVMVYDLSAAATAPTAAASHPKSSLESPWHTHLKPPSECFCTCTTYRLVGLSSLAICFNVTSYGFTRQYRIHFLDLEMWKYNHLTKLLLQELLLQVRDVKGKNNRKILSNNGVGGTCNPGPQICALLSDWSSDGRTWKSKWKFVRAFIWFYFVEG